MQKDAKAYVRKCKKCQLFAPVINIPAADCVPIFSPVPFAQWGMDILGPFKTASGGRKYLIVAIDYFTKWIEAVPTAGITKGKVQSFIWDNVLTRFGVPEAVVFDHGTQFDNHFIKQWLEGLHIKVAYSSVCHPQSNGQAEAANKQILGALKKKLDESKGKWADLVPEILWANRTTEKEATGESPYKLAFGSDALVPVELTAQSFRVKHSNPETNDQALRENLDFLPEIRQMAATRIQAQKERMVRTFNRKIKKRNFQAGDLVLRKTLATGRGHIDGKLSANWEGPYQVTKVIGPGTYQLTDLSGNELTNTWNVDVLRKFYC